MIGQIAATKASFASGGSTSLILNAAMLVGEVFSNAYSFAKMLKVGVSLFVSDLLPKAALPRKIFSWWVRKSVRERKGNQ